MMRKKKSREVLRQEGKRGHMFSAALATEETVVTEMVKVKIMMVGRGEGKVPGTQHPK